MVNHFEARGFSALAHAKALTVRFSGSDILGRRVGANQESFRPRHDAIVPVPELKTVSSKHLLCSGVANIGMWSPRCRSTSHACPSWWLSFQRFGRGEKTGLFMHRLVLRDHQRDGGGHA
jgi:hypothetical protein